MEKRILIAVIFSFVLIFFYNMFIMEKYKTKESIIDVKSESLNDTSLISSSKNSYPETSVKETEPQTFSNGHSVISEFSQTVADTE
ncbi:MAG TPA: hypothetical protein PLQ81_08985, partial [bacterium]|nr:hypothetical protein [bacterium]